MARGKLIIETLFEYNPKTSIDDKKDDGFEIEVIKNHLNQEVLGRRLFIHSIDEFFMLVRKYCELKTGEEKIKPYSKGVFVHLKLDPDTDT